MEKKIITTTLICDCCGKDVERFADTSESCFRVITEIKFDIWYAGTYKIEDICNDCNTKIISFLLDSKMLEGLVRMEST